MGLLPESGCLTGNLQAGCLGQIFHGLGKTLAFIIHDKADGVAAGAAAKAVVELLVGADTEGRGFFLVEGASGGVVAAALFELYATVDHIDYVDTIE